jgi:hypothetical protein
MYRALSCAPLFLGLAAVACSGSGPVSGGNCVTNRDCPTDEVCYAGQCRKTSKSSCDGDAACPAGQFCDLSSGVCRERQTTLCQNDEACPPSQRCNTTTSVCIDGARGCTSESQCAMIGKHCDLATQQCKDCVDSSHCQNGWMCAAGTCVDPNNTTTCTGDFTCGPPNTICEAGMCVPGCAAPANPLACGMGTSCNATSGRCTPDQATCSQDAECGPPTGICESSRCIAGCTQPGGLTCTGGNVCEASTGRCAPPSGCSGDVQCGAPARVCENSACVPGCSQPGGLACGAGTVCDNASGRCVPLQGPCMSDTQCSPPDRVCELGQCVPGCAQPGGLQCSGNTVCNGGTGRCDPGQGMCTSDAQCGAPSNVCDLNTGRCVPGCLSAGCPAQENCNSSSGRCEPVQNGAALGAPCNVNTDCGSSVCFDIESVGKRCVQSCGSSAHCPASFTCFDYTGAKMCLSNQLFGGASFSQQPGGTCGTATDCKSGYCPSNRCVETCNEDNQCSGGTCGWKSPASNIYVAGCDGPTGTQNTGASCQTDGQCRSGVCFQNNCKLLCGSTADCGNGSTCAPINYSICTFSVFGVCLSWAPNFVRACAEGPHGTGAVGDACSTYTTCRSGLCHTGIGQCTDTCSVDADCPNSHRCKVTELGQLSDDTIVYVNVCLPAAM